MKTTIKLTTSTAMTIEPAAGGVLLVIDANTGLPRHERFIHLSQDQAGALIFALEQAAEAAKIAQERLAA